MAVEVRTTDYEFAHGKKPRGYGCWAFFFDAVTEPFWHTGKYAEAKKMAVAYAVTKGYRVVRVGS
jgi:hypothetical protein